MSTNKHTEWEIERKFVVSHLPDGLLETRQYNDIRQGYLAFQEDKEIRIRDKSGSYTMTIKQGSGLKRLETEIDLQAEQFDALWPLTQGARLEKRRYKIAFLQHKLALDVFSGGLEPLKLVEVEFDSEEESRHFLPPDFAEQDVTTNADFKNVRLARFGLPPMLRHQQD